MKLDEWKGIFALSAVLVLALTCSVAAGTYEAPLDVRPEGKARFTAEPKTVKNGAGIKISFTVSAPTDVEVAIVDAKGAVIRHLASGLLGKNAPAPFKKDALAQKIEWDGKDDFDKVASGGPFKVRVRLGLGAELDRFIPKEPAPLPLASAIGVAPDGTLYVMASCGKPGGAYLLALDRDGKYLRTVLPSPAGLKAEQVKGLGRVKLRDETEVPIVYHAGVADCAPYVSGFRAQRLAITSRGLILMASGGNNWMDQAVPRHVRSSSPTGPRPRRPASWGSPWASTTGTPAV